jgi:hypothetical protein
MLSVNIFGRDDISNLLPVSISDVKQAFLRSRTKKRDLDGTPVQSSKNEVVRSLPFCFDRYSPLAGIE